MKSNISWQQYFYACWAAANPARVTGQPLRADALDAALHADRLTDTHRQRTYQAELAQLPDGVFIQLIGQGEPHLWWRGALRPWTPYGYAGAVPAPVNRAVTALTPATIVNAIAQGYTPHVHPSVWSAMHQP